MAATWRAPLNSEIARFIAGPVVIWPHCGQIRHAAYAGVGYIMPQYQLLSHMRLCLAVAHSLDSKFAHEAHCRRR
jgi:hypothetical protein